MGGKLTIVISGYYACFLLYYTILYYTVLIQYVPYKGLMGPRPRPLRARMRGDELRSIFTLRIVGPRIFESAFRNHCAKKLDGALRKSTSFV